jgi:PQQ-like domain
VYVEISDFVAVNTAGLPELGQMLSSALQKLTEPLALIAVGTVIFLGVLGFNLLGEGLRREVSVEGMRRSRLAGLLPQDWAEKLEHRLMLPVSDWLQDHRRLVSALVFAFLLLAAAWIGRDLIYIPGTGTRQGAMPVPGGHLWASERRDPYGTLWTEVSLESAPEILWSYPLPGGPAGGPAVSKDGVIYIAALEQVLVALNPDGSLQWEAPLQAGPVGGPALDATGNIYVADVDGGVTAFSPAGEQLWRTQASDVRDVTAGPVVTESGTIYVTIIDTIAALSSEGELIWRKGAVEVYTEFPPRLSARGDMLFLLDAALAAVSGTRQAIELIPEAALLAMDPAFLTGADGKDYYRYGHELMDWHLSDTGAVAGESRTWSYQSMVLFNPYDQGVTPDGLGWLYYTTPYTESRMVWIDESSRVVGNYLFPRINAHLVALGGRNEAYMCGTTGAVVECVCAAVGQGEPLWLITIDRSGEVAGGALVPGRLYVAIEGDGLFALEPPR